MERESQSPRGALAREQQSNRILELEAENQRLQKAVVGLGSIVAQAQLEGFIFIQNPKGGQQ